MERHEDAVFALSKLNLDNIEKTIQEAYHQEGPGRPPRNPLGIFKALMTKRLRQIPSDRELYRRLWNDPTLRARIRGQRYCCSKERLSISDTNAARALFSKGKIGFWSNA